MPPLKSGSRGSLARGSDGHGHEVQPQTVLICTAGTTTASFLHGHTGQPHLSVAVLVFTTI